MCHRLLRFRPDLDDIVGNKIKKRKNMVKAQIAIDLPIEAIIEKIQQRVCCVIILLIRGLLFSNNFGSRIPLQYLFLLEDLEVCRRLS